MSDEKPADTGKVLWPETPLGPFRYAIVDGIALEYKDGKWFDKNGEERTVTLAPANGVAAHRP
jgi:hypothetical protein